MIISTVQQCSPWICQCSGIPRLYHGKQYKIGCHSLFQHTNVIPVQTFCTVYRCHLKYFFCIDPPLRSIAWMSTVNPVNIKHGSQLSQHISAVVAGSAVYTDTYGNPPVSRFQCRSNRVSQSHMTGRRLGHRRAVSRYNIQFFCIMTADMGKRYIFIDPANLLQPLMRSAIIQFCALFDLIRSWMEMSMTQTAMRICHLL